MNIQTSHGALRTLKPRWAEADIIQIAFITPDLRAAIDFWCGAMGVGPFFETRRVMDSTYMGKPTSPHVTAMMGYWGELQVELIAQHNDAPSSYLGFDGGPFRLHHVCIETLDIEVARAKVLADGGTIVQTNDLPGGGVFYADVGKGPLLEVAQTPDYVRPLVAHMKQAAREWDGTTDPVRPMTLVRKG